MQEELSQLLGESQTARLSLTIPGLPISGSQLKFNRTTGHAYRPTAHKQRVFTIYEYAEQAVTNKGIKPEDFPLFKHATPLAATVRFWFPYRSTDFRTGKYAGLLKENAPTWVLGNKDLDNLLKPLKDGLKGVVYGDDKQIVFYEEVSKMYSENPRTELTIRRI